jgi:hypothetical protein
VTFNFSEGDFTTRSFDGGAMNFRIDTHTRNSVYVFSVAALLVFAGLFTGASLHSKGTNGKLSVTYVRGTLYCKIPYHSAASGEGHLIIEVLDPEDNVLGQTEGNTGISAGDAQWQEEVRLDKALAIEDLVWQRLRYRFEYNDRRPAMEGTESISSILRMPVVHILGQQSYLSGGEAAVRVIVTDSQNELIEGPGSVRIEILADKQQPSSVFPRGWLATIN